MPRFTNAFQNNVFAMNEEETRNYVRRHLHDMRNHLNGIEMDAVLLDTILPEGDEATDAVRRIRGEVALIEPLLKGFAIRFGPLSPQRNTAADVFTLWQSRSGKTPANPAFHWHCEVRGESIHVDMKVLADALCELLPGRNSGIAVEISAQAMEGGVRFQVRQKGVSASQGAVDQARLPGFEDVIVRNGGLYRRELDHDTGELNTSCWFPCDVADGGSGMSGLSAPDSEPPPHS